MTMTNFAEIGEACDAISQMQVLMNRVNKLTASYQLTEIQVMLRTEPKYYDSIETAKCFARAIKCDSYKSESGGQ